MLKKILVTSALVALTTVGFSSANAAANGIYVNGQLGYANTNYDSPTPRLNVDSTGFAWRAAGGYQFTQNWAAELGYTSFPNTDFTVKGLNLDLANVKQYAIDLVAKGMLPVSNGFGLFGTLGAAYLHAKADTFLGNAGSTSKIQPTFGLGASYDITNNLPVTVSWQHIQKTGGSDLKNTDFYSVGLEYHFG